jgi:cytochrome c-type biogenesis protein
MEEGLTLGAMGAAFASGWISVLSPCVMPLMPAYLSLISGVSVEDLADGGSGEDGLRGRVMRGCLGFVAGFSTVFIALGASASAIGRVLRTFEVELFGLSISAIQIAGFVILLMGIHLTGLLPIQALYRDTRFHNASPRGPLGTYLVGAAFAFGWSPCVGPILGGILTLAGAQDTAGEGMALLALYSLGLGIPFFIAGWSIEWFFRSLARIKQHFRKIEIGSGLMLVALGVLVMTNRLTALNDYFSFLNSVVETMEGWLL